jgi:hypothetical protein
MSFTRAVLAAFIGGVLAIVFVLAWRASQETGKSIPASLTDVPAEAQKVYSDVKSRATEAVSTGREAYHKTEATIRERFTSSGDETQGVEEA